MRMSHLTGKRFAAFIAIVALLAASIVLAVMLWPSGLRKPAVIPPGDYTYAIQYVDHQVNRLMRRHGLPSVVVALVDDQEVIFEQAYGLADVERAVPATLDTVYKLGSVTKLFTGIEIMRMWEQGLVDLDAPITEYLPDFTIKSRFPDSSPMTIRSILAHRSGLPRNDTLLEWYWEARPDVLKKLTESLADAYQALPVGYRYKYSNVGYNVLGRIIEVIRQVQPPTEDSAGGWPYHMKDELLTPMGMKDTAFGSDMLLYGRESRLSVAMGYHREAGKNTACTQFDIIDLASGNMQSTMHDMIKFTRYLFGVGESGSESIIARDTLWSMFEQQYGNPRDPQTNGLTWFTDRKQLGGLMVFHSGTNQGFTSLVALVPERKLGFIVFSNSDAFEDAQNQLAIDTLGLMLETKCGVLPPQEKTAAQVDVDRAVLERYVGKYSMDGEIVEVVLAGDRARAVYQGQKIAMVPVSQTRFRLSHWLADVESFELEFFVDSPGDEDIMVVTLGGSYHITCPRYPDLKEVPSRWTQIIGEYDAYPRVGSSYSDAETLGSIRITIANNVLSTSDGRLLRLISDTDIIIVGGIFDGETMIYDDETGNITWQDRVYRPARAAK